MELIATNSIDPGERKHRLAPCGFPDDEIEISRKSPKFSRVAVKEEMPLTAPNLLSLVAHPPGKWARRSWGARRPNW